MALMEKKKDVLKRKLSCLEEMTQALKMEEDVNDDFAKSLKEELES